MFERYNEAARRTLFFARYEASEFGSRSIQPEHLLLGLLHDAKGVIGRLLEPGERLRAIRDQTVSRMQLREKFATSVEIPFSATTKRILQFAAEDADRLLHSHIGPEHLLLGMLREGGPGVAALGAQGLELQGVRAEIVRLFTEPEIAAAQRVSDRIEHIKRLVEDLSHAARGSSVEQALVDRIRAELDALKTGPDLES